MGFKERMLLLLGFVQGCEKVEQSDGFFEIVSLIIWSADGLGYDSVKSIIGMCVLRK